MTPANQTRPSSDQREQPSPDNAKRLRPYGEYRHRTDGQYEPRKRPVQARSTASVEAILDATIQVLRKVGKERLTTTLVAARAGVSVGTLYQYFPNKNALLQSVLKRHLNVIAEAVERVCREQAGEAPQQMAAALIHAFFAAKMLDPHTSAALYAVSSDLDGAKTSKRTSIRMGNSVTEMLASARPRLRTDPQLVASVLLGAMTGVSRRILGATTSDKDWPARQWKASREELICFATAYLDISTQR